MMLSLAFWILQRTRLERNDEMLIIRSTPRICNSSGSTDDLPTSSSEIVQSWRSHPMTGSVASFLCTRTEKKCSTQFTDIRLVPQFFSLRRQRQYNMQQHSSTNYRLRGRILDFLAESLPPPTHPLTNYRYARSEATLAVANLDQPTRRSVQFISERGTEFSRIPVSIEYLSISWNYHGHANYLGSKRRDQSDGKRGNPMEFLKYSIYFKRCILRLRLSETNWDSINQRKKFPFVVKTVEVNTDISIDRDLH